MFDRVELSAIADCLGAVGAHDLLLAKVRTAIADKDRADPSFRESAPQKLRRVAVWVVYSVTRAGQWNVWATTYQDGNSIATAWGTYRNRLREPNRIIEDTSTRKVVFHQDPRSIPASQLVTHTVWQRVEIPMLDLELVAADPA